MSLLQAQGAELAMHARGIADGALFMGQSALALGAAVATVLAVAVDGARRAVAAAIVFVAAGAASAWWPAGVPSSSLVPGVLLVLGLVLAAGLRLRGAIAWIAVAVGGVAAGLAGGLQTATWEETLGGLLLLAVLVLAGFQLAARVAVPPRLQRGAATARRMAGAWIAAVGVLLIALWLRRGG